MGAVYSDQRIGGAPVFGDVYSVGGGLAPSNTVVPTVTGSAVQGSTLTASTGTWANMPASYAYRWLRGATVISGATASTYTLQAGDVGSQIRVGVIATNATGSSAEALSLQTAVIAASGDITAPTLSAATAASTGSTTAAGTVTTSETGGTLYRLASVNATESVATVRAAALTQAVAGLSLTFSLSGLAASTAYYAHLVHVDASGNESARVSAGPFTTSAAGGALSDTEFRQLYEWVQELHLVHGLLTGSPLAVTPTTRQAGSVSQSIAEAGSTVTVTRV